MIDIYTAFAQGFLATVTEPYWLEHPQHADQYAQSGLHVNTALGENGDATYLLLRLYGLWPFRGDPDDAQIVLANLGAYTTHQCKSFK